ncbi:hypothetical protein EW146_g3909 [Bondarzewia mesenterica]|uniref:Uncharacterized protein n=1 Tax=Bondarzewia mesenterica TaxID=1095465 RepID=A0A4S4LW58_9AGAM|nr:hypothetical protein EW146_g3909 [Bondarzewia mesenterica]
MKVASSFTLFALSFFSVRRYLAFEMFEYASNERSFRSGMFTDLNAGSNLSEAANYPTGWEAAAGSSVQFTLPDDWEAGAPIPDPTLTLTVAATVTCSGDTDTDTGVPPVTMVEFTPTDDGTTPTVVFDPDFKHAPSNTMVFAESLVDGFNLPVRIDNTASYYVVFTI